MSSVAKAAYRDLAFGQLDLRRLNSSSTAGSLATTKSPEAMFDIVTALDIATNHYGSVGIVRTLPELIVGTLTFALIMLLTIVGNILVILSIFTYRPLRKVQNFFLVSLAAADLSVSILVLPYGIVYFVTSRWVFGGLFCQIWLTSDILLCTSSILNLCAIALDRYWAIHDPITYSNKRTLNLVLVMIVIVWSLSTLISLPPLFGWNNWEGNTWNDCAYTTEPGFIIYSACGSFFIPLIIMTVVYLKIFWAARSRIRKRATNSSMSIRQSSKRPSEVTKLIPSTHSPLLAPCHAHQKRLSNGAVSNGTSPLALPSNGKHHQSNGKGFLERLKSFDVDDGSSGANQASMVDKENEKETESSSDDKQSGQRTCATLYNNPAAILASTMTGIDHPRLKELRENLRLYQQQMAEAAAANAKRRTTFSPPNSAMQNFFKEREKISVTKEKKAAKTLAVIMGVFVLCWLPFFCLYVIMPFCPNRCYINERIFEATNWLGYVNSALNPVIYTIFNLDFRKAFRKLLGDFKRKICCEQRHQL